jgi:hypothetical protein
VEAEAEVGVVDACLLLCSKGYVPTLHPRHRIVYLKGRKGRDEVTQKAKVRAEGGDNGRQVTMSGGRKIKVLETPSEYAPG